MGGGVGGVCRCGGVGVGGCGWVCGGCVWVCGVYVCVCVCVCAGVLYTSVYISHIQGSRYINTN